jgi:hypothetical protein
MHRPETSQQVNMILHAADNLWHAFMPLMMPPEVRMKTGCQSILMNGRRSLVEKTM